MHNLSCMDKIRSPTLDHSSSARALSGRQCPLSFSDMCGNQQLTVIGGSPSTTRDISCLRSRRWVPITFFDSLSIVVKTFQQLASLPIKCARTNLCSTNGPVRKQEIKIYTHMATTGTTSMPAPVFHPTVWGDYFIKFVPEPLQACSFHTYTISLFAASTLLLCV